MNNRILLAIILLLSTLNGKGPAPSADAQSGTVSVERETGVSMPAAEDVHWGVDLTLKFFRETYGIVPSQRIRIVLLPSQSAYIDALLREFKVTRIEAERRARTTSAWTQAGTILIDVGHVDSTRGRLFLVAHELVHQLQMHIAAPVSITQLYWMAEGMADAVAAYIVEAAGISTVEAYRRAWIEALRGRPHPELADLADDSGWFAALDRYGSSATYRVAGLAALLLMERSGQGSLLNFFRLLPTTGASQAFLQTFSMRVEIFVEDYKAYLLHQLQAGALPRAA